MGSARARGERSGLSQGPQRRFSRRRDEGEYPPKPEGRFEPGPDHRRGHGPGPAHGPDTLVVASKASFRAGPAALFSLFQRSAAGKTRILRSPVSAGFSRGRGGEKAPASPPVFPGRASPGSKIGYGPRV